MLQLQEKKRTPEYRQIILVQSENQGIFSVALNKPEEEEVENEL